LDIVLAMSMCEAGTHVRAFLPLFLTIGLRANQYTKTMATDCCVDGTTLLDGIGRAELNLTSGN
jgi:hypothetical protein